MGLGQYHVQVKDEKPPVRESWLSILRECPVKDWWEPLDHSNLLITRDNARLFDEADKDAS